MSTEHGIDDDVLERYKSAKSVYHNMMREDFPDFNPENVPGPINENDDGVAHTTESSGESATWRDQIGRIADLNDDGKIGLDDVKALPGIAENALSAGGHKIGEAAQETLRRVKSAAQSFDASKAGADAQRRLKAATKAFTSIDARGVAAGALHISETAIGVQGLRDRSEARRVLGICHEYYDAAEIDMDWVLFLISPRIGDDGIMSIDIPKSSGTVLSDCWLRAGRITRPRRRLWLAWRRAWASPWSRCAAGGPRRMTRAPQARRSLLN